MRALPLAAACCCCLPLEAGAGPFGPGETLPPTVPAGFAITVAGAAAAPTSLAFSPDGNTLFVATLGGQVLAFPVLGGAALGPPRVFLDAIDTPLGVLATSQGVFVSGLDDSGGLVLRARDVDGDGMAEVREIVISGLPIGRHNTNGMAIGPDGMLYVANGNSTDSGFRSEGGPVEAPPFSGSLIRIDPAATGLTPSATMVVGTGWRNIYDVAFVPPGHPSLPAGRAVIPMNGPDGLEYPQPDGSTKVRPAGEDTLSILDVTNGVVEHFGFPWCLYDRDLGGLAGFTQDPDEGPCDPLPGAAFTGLVSPAAQAKPAALFDLHVSADGLAFNPGTSFPAAYDGDLFVAEFGNFFGDVPRGHKIVRVRFDAAGAVAAVEDFATAVTPLDLTFGPDGALWVADFAGLILRIANLLP